MSDFYITEEFDQEGNPVKKIFDYYKKITERDLKEVNYDDLKDATKLANKDFFGVKFYRRVLMDKADGDDNLTIIQCPCGNNIKKAQQFYKTDYLIFPFPDATKKNIQ